MNSAPYRTIAFIDHYDSFSFNVMAWLGQFLPGMNIVRIPFDDVSKVEWLRERPIPLVFSPGPKSPLEIPSSRLLLESTWGNAPILGVCLGFQLICVKLGANIKCSKRPLHGAKRTILTSSGLKLTFAAYNSLAVCASELPQAWIKAVSEEDEIQAIGLTAGGHEIAAVQFHPESYLSEDPCMLLDAWRESVHAFYLNDAKGGPPEHGSLNLPNHVTPAPREF